MRCFDRFEHEIWVSGLGQRIGDLVREVALMRIVATEFLEQRNDLCGLSLGEDGELEGELLPPCGQLVIVPLRG